MGPTTENRKSCNSNPGSCPARAHPGGTGPGALLSCGLALSLLLTTYYLHPHPLFFQLTIPFIQQPFTQKPLLSFAGALVAGAICPHAPSPAQCWGLPANWATRVQLQEGCCS